MMLNYYNIWVYDIVATQVEGDLSKNADIADAREGVFWETLLKLETVGLEKFGLDHQSNLI